MKLFTLIVLFVYSISISAQPVINSFSPLSGEVGTTVTILGTNFGNTTTANTVYFGAVKANISAASANSLTVKVPYGASYQPISVTANNLTGFSSKPFIVTFTGGGFIDKNSFPVTVDSSTGLTPYTIVSGDIDGDGNPDLLTANRDSNSISILRNITSNKSISFEYQINLASTNSPYAVKLSDLNGDGKLDIVVSTFSGFSSFLNISTPGNISFNTRTDFNADFMGFFRDIDCADFDGDGRTDIATASSGGSGGIIGRVFRNTSSIDSVSFSLPVFLISPTNNAFTGIFCLRATDLDGDTKPDIAFTYGSPNFFSAIKNTSSTGNISFNSAIADIPLLMESSGRGLAVGDMNNDDKPDVIIANHFKDTISILKNNSVGGNISFDIRKDIALGGSPRSLAINDLDGDGKVDLVSANRHFRLPIIPQLAVFKNISSIDSIKLERPVYFSPAEGPWSISLTDFNRDGKADIATCGYLNSPTTASILRNKIGETLYLCPDGNTSIVTALNGTNYQWQMSSDSVNFNNISDNLNYTGSTTSTLLLNNIPSSWYGRQFRCIVDGNYNSIFTITFRNSWTGAINSSWEEAGNWSCNVVPNFNTDVLIKSGSVTLNSNTTIRSLQLDVTANLIVNDGYSLTLTH